MIEDHVYVDPNPGAWRVLRLREYNVRDVGLQDANLYQNMINEWERQRIKPRPMAEIHREVEQRRADAGVVRFRRLEIEDIFDELEE